MSESVLALDPGDQNTAFCVFDGAHILEFGILPNGDILDRMERWRDRYRPHLACEMIASYGMAVGANVFETCVWIGRFMQAWGPCTRIKRGEVKMYLCQSMRAKDANIRQALIDRFGEPGTKKAPGGTYGISKDVWSALAVAVTYWDTMRDAKEQN